MELESTSESEALLMPPPLVSQATLSLALDESTIDH